MEFTISMTADGLIGVNVAGASLLNHALEDAISSRAPRGADPGLSAFWIERALSRLHRRDEDQLAQLFASGNVTFLRVEGETVTAGYEFDADESETEEIARGEMIEILEAWRDAIIAAGGAHGPESMPPDAPPIVV